MPRRWRVDGLFCHVYNRAAAKLTLFRNAADYRWFLGLLRRTKQDLAPSARLYGYCVMPNHWHFIICADTTPALSQFMRYLTRRHAVSFIADHPERSGAIYQGRFKCVPVQDGEHLSTLLRYVDRNPLQAGLVPRAEQWLWSSTLGHAGLEDDPLLDVLPPCYFTDWLARLNQTAASDALAEAALKRNEPIGERDWIAKLSADWTDRRPKGRPRRDQPGKINRDEFIVSS